MDNTLLCVPGIGPSIAADLRSLGIRETGELRGRDPELLYDALCEQKGNPVDRCVLYVFRCAVYFASTAEHDPEKLKWWNWKDRGGCAVAARPHRSARKRSGGS